MKSLLKYRKILKKIEERELVAVTRQSHYNRFEEEISLFSMSNVIPNQTHIDTVTLITHATNKSLIAHHLLSELPVFD